jgi:aspartate kinase
MSFCGAQVLHTRSVEVARRFGVRVHVRSSFRKEMGTIVTSNEERETADIRGIAHDLDAVMVSFNGIERSEQLARRVLDVLQSSDINLRFVYASRAAGDTENLSFLISGEDRESAVRSLEQNLRDLRFTVDDGVAAVSVIGHGICSSPGVANKILCSLTELGISPRIISTSGITLTVVLDRDRAQEALRKLHSDLGLGEPIRSEERQSGRA